MDSLLRVTESIFIKFNYRGNPSFDSFAWVLMNDMSIGIYEIKGIIQDHTISDNELEFIKLLIHDLTKIINQISDDTEINCRKDISFNEFKLLISEFFDSWDISTFDLLT